MNDLTMNGRCTCAAIRYRLTSRPLIVHACHCRWCQRETGTSFAQNALIEADRVVLFEGSPEVVWTPSVLPSFSGLPRDVRKESRKAETLWKRILVVLAGFVCCFLTERDSPA